MKLLSALLLLTLPALALDTAPLTAIRPAMEAAVQAKQAAGIVTMAMQRGRIIHHESVGMADIAQGRAMEKDALFWIASMTKSVNGAAIMTLVDEGRVTLDEPAFKWLPELAEVTVSGGTRPEKPITLRMLLSHTAGIAFPPRKPTDGAISLKAYVTSLLKTPLAFQPGSDYEYGFGPTIAGRIIEIVSGMKYEEYLRTRLFEPLGMKDTTFHPTEAQRARIARTYKMDEESRELVPGYNPFVTPDASVRHMPEPAGGLFSTAADMGRFYTMIALGGELEDRRILSETSVREMLTPVTAGGKQLNYSCGWMHNTPTQRVCPSMPIGSFGHGGAFATNGWLDPQSGIVTVFLVQNVLVPEGGKARDTFQRHIMSAVGISVPPPPARKAKP